MKFNLKKTIGIIGAAVAAAGGVFLAEKAGECTSSENVLPTLEPIDQAKTEPDGESETKSEETEE